MGCCQGNDIRTTKSLQKPLLEASDLDIKQDDSNDIGKIFEYPSNTQEINPDLEIQKPKEKDIKNTKGDKNAHETKYENKNIIVNNNKSLRANENENATELQTDNEDFELPDKFDIKKALIGIIGIKEYNGLPNLDGVSYDYKNIIKTFVATYQHKILYKLDNNELVYTNNIDEIESKNNFKLNWSEDDIHSYTWQLRKHIIEHKHDALLLFIESHGNSEDEIITSDCEAYEHNIPALTSYFKETGGVYFEDFVDFQETDKKSKYLLRIPKILFVDMCRGQITAKPSSLNNNNDNTNEKNNQETKPKIAIKNDKISTSDNDNGTNRDRPKGLSDAQEKKYTSQDANVCTVYGNTNGYTVIGGSKGSQFTSIVCKVFDDTVFVELSDLTKICRQIRLMTKKETTNIGLINSIQTVETVDTMEREVRFDVPDEE